MNSPTPWYRARLGHGSIICSRQATLLPLSAGTRCLDIIARTDWGRGEEDEDNAELILRAANNHKTLLDALKQIREMGYNSQAARATETVLACVRVAEEAIRVAEAK